MYKINWKEVMVKQVLKESNS